MGVSIDISERKRAEEALRASEARLETGAELAGLAFYEVDFDQGAVYVDDRFRDLCGIPAGSRAGPAAPGVLEGASAPRRPSPRAGRSAAGSMTARLQRLSIEYRYLHPAEGRSGSAHRPASHARRRRPHRQDVRCPPRHHRAQARRGGAARSEPAPDRGARGGARAARARAARRRQPAARRAGDRRRPRRARRRRTGRRPRRCRRSARDSCASARTSTPSRTSCTRRSSRSSAWPRPSGRSASGGVAEATSISRWTSGRCPRSSARTRRSACSASPRRR